MYGIQRYFLYGSYYNVYSRGINLRGFISKDTRNGGLVRSIIKKTMLTIQKGVYVTRDKGNWFVVTPFRKIFCFSLTEAVEFITSK